MILLRVRDLRNRSAIVNFESLIAIYGPEPESGAYYLQTPIENIPVSGIEFIEIKRQLAERGIVVPEV